MLVSIIGICHVLGVNPLVLVYDASTFKNLVRLLDIYLHSYKNYICLDLNAITNSVYFKQNVELPHQLQDITIYKYDEFMCTYNDLVATQNSSGAAIKEIYLSGNKITKWIVKWYYVDICKKYNIGLEFDDFLFRIGITNSN